MIYATVNMTIGDNSSICDQNIVLYRGDKNVEIRFVIKGNKFTILDSTYAQMIINRPSSVSLFSEPAEIQNETVVLVISDNMIDELTETGEYTFQIRLYDGTMNARVTLPPCKGCLIVNNPIAVEGETSINNATINHSTISTYGTEEVFDEYNNYNKTTWSDGDLITDAKMNKIEEAIWYNTNEINNLDNYALITDIPTNVSQLHNDSGYLTEHQDISHLASKDYVDDAIESINVGDMSGILDQYAKTEDIPTKVSQLENDKGYLTEHIDISGKVDKVENKGLSTNDLTNKLKNYYDTAYDHSQSSHAPVTAQKNSDITKNEIEAKLTGTINSHQHSYNDLSNKPTIPDAYILPTASSTQLGGIKVGAGLSINNGILSANGGGTADSVDWSNVTNKPTKLSDFTNDKGYITSIPSEYITETELNAKGYLTEHQDLSSYAKVSDIPTKTSQITNDSGYLTSVPSEYITETELNKKGYSTFSGSYNDLINKPTIPTVTNDLTNTLKSNYDTAYAHSQSTHAPTNAQKNSDITKSEIEAKLTGTITSHSHNYSTLSLGTTSTTAYRGDYGNTAYTHSKSTHAPTNAQKNSDITKSEIEAKLTGTITSHSHNYATEYYVDSKIPTITITKLTQSQYNALSTKDSNTLYVIVG